MVIFPQRDSYTQVHGSIMLRAKRLEAIKVPSNRWMNRKRYFHSEIFSLKESSS